MEPCYFGNLSVCHCRELLVIGGVAAKDQLAALEQGVCDTYSYAYSHPQKTKNVDLSVVLITVNQIVEICFLIGCHFSSVFPGVIL